MSALLLRLLLQCAGDIEMNPGPVSTPTPTNFALSNRHPPNILPTIYPCADLPCIFIKHFTNKVEKLRANIASEHVISTLVTGTTAATFSSSSKVSQLTGK